MEKIVKLSANKPTCMMISKKKLVRGIGGGYSVDDREVMEDKICEGFDSLLRLGIRNRALVLDDAGYLCKEVGFLYGRDSKAKYLVKDTGSPYQPFVVLSILCLPISDGDVICNNCASIELK